MRHPSSYNRGKYWPAEIQVPKKCNGGKNRVGPNTWAEVVPSLLSVVPKEVDKDDVLHNFNS